MNTNVFFDFLAFSAVARQAGVVFTLYQYLLEDIILCCWR